MLIDVQYLQKRGKAGWRYRRKVPANLRQAIGQREILRPLGRTEQEALKAYPKVHAEVERRFAIAATPQAVTSPAPMTDLERFRYGGRILTNEWGAVAEEDPGLVADIIKGKYRLYATVDEDGAPGSHRAPLSDSDAATLQASGSARDPSRPLRTPSGSTSRRRSRRTGRSSLNWNASFAL